VADHDAAGNFQTIEKFNSSKADAVIIVLKEAETARTSMEEWESNTNKVLWKGCNSTDCRVGNFVGNVAEESSAHAESRH
jgi:hypothetical protein